MAFVPGAPSGQPSDIQSETSDSQISLSYPEVTMAAETGGHTILSYNLQMDDGAGHFSNVHGSDTDVLDLNALVGA